MSWEETFIRKLTEYPAKIPYELGGDTAENKMNCFVCFFHSWAWKNVIYNRTEFYYKFDIKLLLTSGALSLLLHTNSMYFYRAVREGVKKSCEKAVRLTTDNLSSLTRVTSEKSVLTIAHWLTDVTDWPLLERLVTQKMGLFVNVSFTKFCYFLLDNCFPSRFLKTWQKCEMIKRLIVASDK